MAINRHMSDGTNKFFALLGFLIVLPKVNIIELAGQYPIRLDDVILSVAVFALFLSLISSNLFVLDKISSILILYIFIIIFSATSDVIINKSFVGIMFMLRNIQYLLFFYIGCALFSYPKRLTLIIDYAIGVNLIFCFFQLLPYGIGNQLPVFIYNGGVVKGVMAGPWELGACFNMIIAYILFSKNYTKNYRIALYLITLFVIAQSGSRAPFISHIILGFFALKTSQKSIVIVLSIFLLPVLSLSDIDINVFNRIKQLEFGLSIFDLYSEILSSIDLSDKIIYSEIRGDVSQIDGDLSFILRFYKWIYAFNIWISNLPNILFGLGIGFFGKGLDGGMLRVIFELGLIGFFAFIAFLLFVYRQSYFWTKMMVIVFVINGLFIDVNYAYKTMSIFLLFCGLANAEINPRVRGLQRR